MPKSRSFLDASIPDLVAQLHVDEKIKLLGAPNWWNTSPIERLEIPSIRMSDGPNGVRGSSHFVATPAQCLPCETCMASTFDTDLIHETGVLLAKEAKIKSSVILLAPTCNIQRSPLGGRAFESFSEDPHLSGAMCAAYVNGLQSEGVAATIKHFVGNDQEHERTAAESVMSHRALREVYLYPFMLAQKLAQPWAFMTSYGRIDGVHCAESPALLQGILRDEWKFDGIIMSDWFGTYGTDQAINAGMDLEMPGPPRWRTNLLVTHCLSSQKILQSTLDKRVTAMLSFIQKQARRHPDIVYGDGIERTRDDPETRAFCRKLASSGIVLLKNEGGLLPLSSRRVRKLLLVGPNAKERVISGGGSAALKPSYVVTPFDGINDGAYDGLAIDYTIGCYAHKYLPTLENYLVTPKGESGWRCTFYNHDSDGKLSTSVAEFVVKDTRLKLNDFLPAGLSENWSIKAEGIFTFDASGPFEFGLTVAGRAKCFINGTLLIDNWTKQTPGDFFYGQGTIEERAVINVTAGESIDVLVEYTNSAPPEDDSHGEGRNAQPALMRGVRLGGCLKIDADAAIEEAVRLAKNSDAVVFVAGLTPEWESEGFDRPNLQMPGRQDEVITRISEVNPNTIVVIQAGSAVSMPWSTSVSCIVQGWYLGNESGNALADVLYGKVNPSGRLSLSLPEKIEDVSAYPNLRSEFGKIHYREDLFVGYKGYQSRGIKPLYPFGFGLSYTKFSMSDLSITTNEKEDVSIAIEVKITLRNVGDRTGSEVAQVYVSYPDVGYTTPSLQLKGFHKARDVPPGERSSLSFHLDKYAISSWNEQTNSWIAEKGKYDFHVGFSSADLVQKREIVLKNAFSWTGL